MTNILRIDGANATLVVDARASSVPKLVYVGPPLPPGADLDALAAATMAGPRESTPDEDPGLTFLPENGWGFPGEPAVVAEVEGRGPTRFELAGCDVDQNKFTLRLADPVARLSIRLRWRFLPSGLLAAEARLDNEGSAAVRLHWLAAVALPLPDWACEATQVNGRWAGEFQLATTPLPRGKLEKVNRTGRSGFDGAHYLLCADAGAGDERGRVIAAHLVWSGNGRSLLETLPAGARQLQLGEWLAPGEVMLAPGESYATPEALLAISETGLNGVRHAFHAELRARRAAASVGRGPRKVHFNSWEAVYFDFDEARLTALAESAAALGVERFVVDDGWFCGRRDDRRALGDWTVDPDRFRGGLAPLIDRTKALGMDFGLWVEPEMVSPESRLYLDHPDWCLHAQDRARPTQRHQLVLDLTRREVRDHLFDTLDRLLRNNAIAYLKWDHNRDLFPAISRGRPAVREQTLGYYELIDRVRAAHPGVEIESCASGGARIDFAVAARTDRVWASDNTDAVERLRMHRGLSLFYPPELIGAHFGAAPNPTTGRRVGVDFRARIMMFAHFGIEADPARLSPAEGERLADHVAQYRRWRGLIHDGRQFYADCDDPGVTTQVVVASSGSEALALVARIGQATAAVAPLVRLPGLDPRAAYRLTLVEPWPQPAARQLGELPFWRSRPVVDGATLGQVGLRLPIVHPETAWLLHLERDAR
jgi:alpha-galactosidase